MKSQNDFRGKNIFVTGGSGGLGKAIAKLVVSRGGNVTIFGRREDALNDACAEIRASKISEDQIVHAAALDLSDYAKVNKSSSVKHVFLAQPQIPDALYCAAGGNHAENGFLVDVNDDQIDRCMKNNFYATVYPTKVLVDIWVADDKQNAQGHSKHRHRQIIIVSSAAAFLGLPGSIAYTPAKVAVRALADTLRMEFLRYSSSNSTYTAHCAFPGDFVSPGFYLEQNTKTNLTKRMQGTNKTLEELETNCPSSDKVASSIVSAVERGEFIICSESLAASLLFTNMIGPSPKRGFGIFDSLIGILTGWIVWPVLRRRWEAMCKTDGYEWRKTWFVSDRNKQD